MPNNDPVSKLWNWIVGWAHQNATHYLYVPIDKARTDETYDDSPLVADQDYFRLWLVEMFLSDKRSWFTDLFPAVHTNVKLKFGDSDTIQLSNVARAPDKSLADSVLLNFDMTELMPFCGGVVELEAALLAFKGKNYLQAAIGILEKFSGLVSAPIGQAIEIATNVSAGVQELLGATDGEVHLGHHQAFTSAGSGGNPLKPGYFAVVLADAQKLKPADFSIVQNRLRYQKKPLVGYDYMLFRLEGREERDDWRLKTIQAPLDKAIEAAIQGESEKAQAFKKAALIAALQSDDLTKIDRRRVMKMIKEEIEECEELGLGATGEETRDLNQIFQARAISRNEAIAMGAPTLEEFIDIY